MFALKSHQVFYGRSAYDFYLPEGKWDRIQSVEDINREELIADMAHGIGSLGYREVEARLQPIVRTDAISVDGRQLVPELIIARGNGFSVVWARQSE